MMQKLLITSSQLMKNDYSMIKKLLPFFPGLSWAWLFLILLFAVYDTRSLFFENKVQFDLMSLLPKSKTETLKTLNNLMDEANIAGHVLILVGHKDATVSQNSFRQMRNEINKVSLPLKEQTSTSFVNEYKQLFKELYPYRTGLLSENDRQLLLENKGNVLTKKALADIMLPFGSLGPTQLKSDPFSLYPHFISSLQPSTVLQHNDKGETFFQSEGKTWFLFKAMMTEPAFSIKTQEEMTAKLDPIFAEMLKTNGLEILKTGAIFYASAASKQANNEVSFMGFASMFAIFIILLFTFNTVRPLLFAIAVISSGLIAGLATCLFIFGTVHILALVFGSSLVGVTVDYSLHYYCASFKHDKSISSHRLSVLKSLMPALFLGVLSSVIGYSLLIVPPFPGVQQLAVLASVGLFSSFLTVCLWGPYVVKLNSGNVPPIAKKIQEFLTRTANYGRYKSLKIILSIGLFSLFLIGVSVLTFEDDVRSFQSLDRSLKEQEARISSMIKLDTAPKFLIIKKPTLEEVLQVDEKISADLEKARKNGELTNYHNLSKLIPSQKRQVENRQLVEENLYKIEGERLAKTLGFEHGLGIENINFQTALFTLNEAHFNLLPSLWRELIQVHGDRSVTSRILLYGIKNAQVFSDIGSKYEGVTYIDPPLEYSLLFASYRQIMLWILLAVYSGIALFLFLWKGLQKTIIILSPVGLSVLATIGIVGLTGSSFNLFHAMGLLLVLSIGIDYAFFLYWRKALDDSVKEGNLLLLANGLAALTTILSFGLLAFSKTSAIHSFGLTVFIGITLNFCVTTLYLGKSRLENDS